MSCLGIVLLLFINGRFEPRNGQSPSPAPDRRTDGSAGVADFRDVAAAAGLSARTVIGGERTKDYILETTGGGLAIVDYDNDDWPDIFLLNGARRTAPGIDDAPASHLYRNKGDGTFVDVTSQAGLGARGWGQGVCGRRLRQRR